MTKEQNESGIYFVYDGDCPLCKSAAAALKIKERYGELYLINARENTHQPLLKEIERQGFDLDEGMVIYDGEKYYHAEQALMFMARYGKWSGVFNIINKLLFWSKWLARWIYPYMRAIRNALIERKNVKRLDNLKACKEPIFKNVFGDDWQDLPLVLRRHYQNRPYTHDKYRVNGLLDVSCFGLMKFLAPLVSVLKGIPPYTEESVPVTVEFKSKPNSKEFIFDRTFHFSGRDPYRFHSRMRQIRKNIMVEVMSYGIAWVCAFEWQDNQVKLKHKGYAFQFFGYLLPLPVSFLIGKGNAYERAIDDKSFEMQVEIRHPWWGKLYEYKGHFTFEDRQ